MANNTSHQHDDLDVSCDDYEVCGTCGYDHEYDLPLLTPDEYTSAVVLHRAAERSYNEEACA